jgi:chromosome segregation ATPase
MTADLTPGQRGRRLIDTASDEWGSGDGLAWVMDARNTLLALLDALDEAERERDEARAVLAGAEANYEQADADRRQPEAEVATLTEALARVEALRDEWRGEARAHREAAVRDADIERDWIAGSIEHRLAHLDAALAGPTDKGGDR